MSKKPVVRRISTNLREDALQALDQIAHEEHLTRRQVIERLVVAEMQRREQEGKAL